MRCVAIVALLALAACSQASPRTAPAPAPEEEALRELGVRAIEVFEEGEEMGLPIEQLQVCVSRDCDYVLFSKRKETIVTPEPFEVRLKRFVATNFLGKSIVIYVNDNARDRDVVTPVDKLLSARGIHPLEYQVSSAVKLIPTRPSPPWRVVTSRQEDRHMSRPWIQYYSRLRHSVQP